MSLVQVMRQAPYRTYITVPGRGEGVPWTKRFARLSDFAYLLSFTYSSSKERVVLFVI